MLKLKSRASGIIALLVLSMCIYTPLAQASIFSMIATFLKTLNSEMNAIAITVKQTALSSNQLQNTIMQTDKTLAESVKILNQSLRVSDAYIKYGLATGQPASTNHISMLETEGMLLKQKSSSAAHLQDMQNYVTTLTHDANNSPEKIAQATHNQYCSESESKLKLCAQAAPEKQNMDNNFALTFGQDILTADKVQGAKDYTKNIVMLNMDSNSNCTTADCTTGMAAELGYNAFASMAAYSLNQQITEKASGLP
jgi:hypothetical protein